MPLNVCFGGLASPQALIIATLEWGWLMRNTDKDDCIQVDWVTCEAALNSVRKSQGFKLDNADQMCFSL